MTAQRGYEALVILKPGGTEEEIARHTGELEAQVKKLGGSIDSSQQLGRRRLAFPILRQAEGHYYLLRFQAPTEQVAELEHLFRLDERIVRFIILSQDEAAPMPTAAPAAAARSY